MKYGDILKKAYNITIKNKILWIFGILIGGGASCGGNFSYSGTDFDDLDSKVNNNLDFSVITDYWYIIAIIILLLLVLYLVMLIFSIIGKGALYHGIAQAAGRKKVSLGNSFSHGVSMFWKVFGIQILTGLAVVAVASIILLPGFLLLIIPIIGWILGAILIFIGIIFIIAASLFLSVIMNYIFCFAVLKDKGIIDSFKLSWLLLKSNLQDTILMALILWGINVGLMIVMILIVVALLIIFGLLGLLLYFAFEWIGVIIAAIIGILIIFISISFIQGIINVYVYSAWYYTWKEIVDKK